MLIYSTQQWLMGGTYADNFFTPNPPMIFFLYLPPIFLSNFFHLPIAIAFRIYIFVFAFLSFYFCYHLLQVLLKSQPLKYIFLTTLLFLYLIFPSYEFGQRDHLLLMTTLPYSLLIVMRLEKNAINLLFSIIIGFFAGIGFALKPQFIIIPLLLESYFCYQSHRFYGWVRSETITILIVLGLYLLGVWFLFKDYVFIILPYIWYYYYKSVGLPWSMLIFNDFIFFALLAIVVFFIQRKVFLYKTLRTILLICLFGFLFTYFSQRSIFYYHIIPFVSLSTLLLLLLFNTLSQKYSYLFNILLAVCFFTFPAYFLFVSYEIGNNFKNNVLKNLIAFMQSVPAKQSIYVFSEANYLTPLIYYTNNTTGERFDCLWMIESLIQKRKEQGDANLRKYIQMNHDNYFFINMIATDFARHKPTLVLVDTRKNNSWLTGRLNHFDYLNYFLENSQFNHEWRAYRYLTTLSDQHHQYKLDVYKRTTV